MVEVKLVTYAVFLIILLWKIEDGSAAKRKWRSKCPELKIANAQFRPRNRGRVGKIRCNSGYSMIEGDRRLFCLQKEWIGRIPHCIKNGCENIEMDNGNAIKLYSGALIHFKCNPGYYLEGSPALFCNGSNWNASAPTCEGPPPEPMHVFCTFESKDMCGWTQDELDEFDWKWTVAFQNVFTGSFGAKIDHTYGVPSGHYIYADSAEQWQPDSIARLYSPVVPVPNETPACVVFYYHMYGPTSGSLNVYVKPESISFDILVPAMSVTGFHPDAWMTGFVPLEEELDENIQIILEAEGGDGHMSDVAVDDFKLTSGDECISLEIQFEEEQRMNTLPPPTEEDIDIESTVYPVTEGLESTTRVLERTTSASASTSSTQSTPTTKASLPTKPTTVTMVQTENTPKKVYITSTEPSRSKTMVYTYTQTPEFSSSTLMRKTLTPKSITVRVTTHSSTTSIYPTSSVSSSTSNHASEVSSTLGTSTLRIPTSVPTSSSSDSSTSDVVPSKIPFSPIITHKTTTYTTTESRDRTTLEHLKQNTDKPISISRPIKEKKTSSWVTVSLMAAGVVVALTGFTLAFLWHRKRKRQLLAEGSDFQQLNNENKEDDPIPETEDSPRRVFSNSYRLFENSSYPQEYEGTSV